MEKPNILQIIIVIIIAILWLGVGNLIILDSIRRQKLSLSNIFNPFIWFKLQIKDWAKILLLIVVTALLVFAMQSLESF